MDEPRSPGQPSVLDYLKFKLAPWKYPPVEITAEERVESPPDNRLLEEIVPAGEKLAVSEPAQPEGPDPNRNVSLGWPWRTMAALLAALAAQRILEPSSGRTWNDAVALGVVLYIVAAVLAAWASWGNEWRIANPPEVEFEGDNLRVRGVVLFVGVALALLAFLAVTDDRFNILNISLFGLALLCLVAAFWQRVTPTNPPIRKPVGFQLGPVVLFGIILVFSAYFRFAQLNQIPGEMNSDHAEKILDIIRLLGGQTSIFFPNNGGREALQMYLAAGLVKGFGLSPNFILLKAISSVVGFLTLPFIYLIGKEIANQRVGLLAMAFAGVAYWPNVVSRLGLRLPFYFLFSAATLFFLIRGLRRGRRNDFILLGLIVGLSLYGYSADRILPLVVLLGILLFFVHTRSRSEREQALWFGLMALVIAGVMFFPMLRYFLDQPGIFLYRTLTRVSGVEHPLSAPAALIFLRNTGRALVMFSWSNGEIWTTSIPYRPALDVVSGALFWSGVVLSAVAYIRRQHWIHLFLLFSIPLFMLPSILALAFPNENPNLYRTAGAAIPVFLLVGLALDGFMRALEERGSRAEHPADEKVSRRQSQKWLGWGLAGILLFLSAYQSYHLVFTQYRLQYQLAAWNTSEMGEVVRDFAGTYGSADNVWVMGYPYWVDTRLVGIEAGYPLRDFALFPEGIGRISENPEAKLFIINPQDIQSISALQQRFAQGVLTSYPTMIPGKEFLIFFVPPQMG